MGAVGPPGVDCPIDGLALITLAPRFHYLEAPEYGLGVAAEGVTCIVMPGGGKKRAGSRPADEISLKKMSR